MSGDVEEANRDRRDRELVGSLLVELRTANELLREYGPSLRVLAEAIREARESPRVPQRRTGQQGRTLFDFLSEARESGMFDDLITRMKGDLGEPPPDRPRGARRRR